MNPIAADPASSIDRDRAGWSGNATRAAVAEGSSRGHASGPMESIGLIKL
jgi:hypothetical protein